MMKIFDGIQNTSPRRKPELSDLFAGKTLGPGFRRGDETAKAMQGTSTWTS